MNNVKLLLKNKFDDYYQDKSFQEKFDFVYKESIKFNYKKNQYINNEESNADLVGIFFSMDDIKYISIYLYENENILIQINEENIENIFDILILIKFYFIKIYSSQLNTYFGIFKQRILNEFLKINEIKINSIFDEDKNYKLIKEFDELSIEEELKQLKENRIIESKMTRWEKEFYVEKEIRNIIYDLENRSIFETLFDDVLEELIHDYNKIFIHTEGINKINKIEIFKKNINEILQNIRKINNEIYKLFINLLNKFYLYE